MLQREFPVFMAFLSLSVFEQYCFPETPRSIKKESPRKMRSSSNVLRGMGKLLLNGRVMLEHPLSGFYSLFSHSFSRSTKFDQTILCLGVFSGQVYPVLFPLPPKLGKMMNFTSWASWVVQCNLRGGYLTWGSHWESERRYTSLLGSTNLTTCVGWTASSWNTSVGGCPMWGGDHWVYEQWNPNM